ncbi:olfactory receptor 2K2-like [Alligator mississippiensis]|uniref:olfactory receptor 2K2-like n=1 Tax=Alligator mississippiensis TaxID=8496 RepID=UPI0028775DFA|nr:olfactory receptor 2K2-like [Alligator mississippiensis]XP_059570111.1 olfactory receptor 2K2-like [Alligator mississippiensis]
MKVGNHEEYYWGNSTSVSEFILLGFSSQPKTQLLLFVFFLTIYLATLFGHSLLIALVKTDSRLHTPVYFFLANLSFLEISYTTTTVPQMLVHLLSTKKSIFYAACVAQMFIFLSLAIIECILYAAMAYDRYVAICHPLRYTIIRNRSVCVKMAISFWVSGFLLSIMNTGFTMRFPYCLNEINHFFCEVPAILKLACADTRLTEQVTLLMAVILLLTPLSLILISYVFILEAILRISSAEGRFKAFSTCTSHITVVTLFYGTAVYMYMRPASSYSPEWDKTFSLLYNVVSGLLNPLIYSLRNKEVKGAVLKMMGKTDH